MECRTPDLQELSPTNVKQVTYNFGFVMDNITELLDLQSKSYRIKRAESLDGITYYADPKVERLSKLLKYKKGETIDIQVKWKNFYFFKILWGVWLKEHGFMWTIILDLKF